MSDPDKLEQPISICDSNGEVCGHEHTTILQAKACWGRWPGGWSAAWSATRPINSRTGEDITGDLLRSLRRR